MADKFEDIMQVDPREILIFYNPDINKHKKTVAHAKSVADYIKTRPFSEIPTAHNVWTTIYEALDVDAMNIFDDTDPRFDELVKGRDLDFEGWYKVVVNNPNMIRSPIAIRDGKAVLCDRQTEIYQLMEGSPNELKKKYADSTPIRDDEERLPGADE